MNCSHDGCGSPVSARSLCRNHYQALRRAEKKAAAIAVARTCPVCAVTFHAAYAGRIFCSRKCRTKWHNDAYRARKVAARVDRECRGCGALIPAEVHARRLYCSLACQLRSYNKNRRAANRAANRAAMEPCATCGVAIPDDGRRASVRYCSPECKQRGRAALAPGYKRKYNYGITQEQYDAMLAAQGHRCAICRTDRPKGHYGWHVDHDHKTGKVRGLLCGYCNVGISRFKDDPAICRAAADYLAAA